MIRVALVGFGRIAPSHVEALRASGAQVVAASSRSPAGRERARQAGIERTFAEPDEMIDGVRPDAVCVLTSVLSNFAVTRQLIPRGLPLLVEKPPGTSLAEAEDLAALAGRHATPVMVALNRRFYSVLHGALERLGGREALTAVSVEWSEDPAAMLRAGHPPELIPRLVFANSLHGLDLWTLLAGEPDAVGVWGRDLGEGRWQMEATGLGTWGARLRFSSTWDAPVGWRLVMEAPGGRVVCAPLETALWQGRGGSAEALEPEPADRRLKPGFAGQAEAFLGVARGTGITWPACSIHAALPAMRLAHALTRACTSTPAAAG